MGSAVSFFLWSLQVMTRLHWDHPWLLYLLPVAGLISGLIYHRFGQGVESGNNLVLEQIHEPGGGIPIRMAPLVLLGTLITHVCGGSAGREGTAVQMGGSLASGLARLLRLTENDVRLLLMAGIAAGFGAVFGTPLAGTLFALEVLVIGRLSYQAVLPCLIASIVGDMVVTAWGIGHTHYFIQSLTTAVVDDALDVPKEALGNNLNGFLIGKVALSAVLFGLVSILFIELTHSIQRFTSRWISRAYLRPMIGGCVVVLIVLLLGDRSYTGLGVESNPHDPQSISIVSAFQPGGADRWSWWWKLLLTAITVGSGFKGGEVTPLFFIGATLGNVLGGAMGVPVDFMAALGFVAVFAAATNTPLACTIMAVELFAPSNGTLLESGFLIYAAIACFLSYSLSGNASVYTSQRRPGSSSESDPTASTK